MMMWYLAITTLFCLVELSILSPYLKHMPVFPVKKLHGSDEMFGQNNWFRRFSFLLLSLPVLVFMVDVFSEIGWANAEWPASHAFSASLLGVSGILTSRISRQRDDKFLYLGHEKSQTNEVERTTLKELTMSLRRKYSVESYRHMVLDSEVDVLRKELEKLEQDKAAMKKQNRSLSSELREKQMAIEQHKKDIDGAIKRRKIILEKMDEAELDIKGLRKKLKRAMNVEKEVNNNLQELLDTRERISTALNGKKIENRQKRTLAKKHQPVRGKRNGPTKPKK